MGNFASCCFPDQRTKLFDADGNLKQLKMPITAAELMLEAPGHVVCSLDSLVKSRRVIALRADDELAMGGGGVYMLVQVNRMNCMVSELEIAMIQSACAKKLLTGVRRGGSNKVLPEIEKAAGSTAVAITSGDGNGCRRNCRVRQWNPVLEPITEIC